MTTPTPVWMKLLRGKFVVFDGPDGSGKSTQWRRFSHWARQAGLAVCEVRDPGGTPIGEKIRQILLDPNHGEMNVRCEMLLYMASRAQLAAQIIGPARLRGELVLADRFVSSTLAYQGTAGGLAGADIMAAARLALDDLWPDLHVIFDVDPATAATRRKADPDRIEQRDSLYHRRVRQGFLDQAQADPERFVVVDADGGIEKVFAQLLIALESRLLRPKNATTPH